MQSKSESNVRHHNIVMYIVLKNEYTFLDYI